MIDLLKFSLKPPIFAVENSRYLLYFEFFPVLYFGGGWLAGLVFSKSSFCEMFSSNNGIHKFFSTCMLSLMKHCTLTQSLTNLLSQNRQSLHFSYEHSQCGLLVVSLYNFYSNQGRWQVGFFTYLRCVT